MIRNRGNTSKEMKGEILEPIQEIELFMIALSNNREASATRANLQIF